MSTSTPGADDLGMQLVPPDDAPLTPEADLAAATASALEDPLDPQEVADDAPEPFGRTWQMDWDTGRFVRNGGSPAVVTGTDALAQWCTTALNVARFAHPIFSEDFGMEGLGDAVGDGVGDEAEVDFAPRARDALLVHDRISDVEVSGISFDPTTGVMVVGVLRVFTDEEEPVVLDGLQIPTDTEA